MDRMTNAIKIAIAVVKAAAAQTLPASVLASSKCSCTAVQVQAMTDRVQLSLHAIHLTQGCTLLCNHSATQHQQ